jgi:hypothetical protein
MRRAQLPAPVARFGHLPRLLWQYCGTDELPDLFSFSGLLLVCERGHRAAHELQRPRTAVDSRLVLPTRSGLAQKPVAVQRQNLVQGQDRRK